MSCVTPHADAAFKELVLTLPSETYIAEQPRWLTHSVRICHAVRESMRTQLAVVFNDDHSGRLKPLGQRRLPARSCSSGQIALAGMALTNSMSGRERRRHLVWH
jgi:aminopeptidase N